MWLLTALAVLAVWTVLAFPLAVLVGRSFRAGSRPDLTPVRPVPRELVSG
jgi:hypothetical protein